MESEHGPAGIVSQLKSLVASCLSSLQNRSELLLVELEEEKTNFIELLVWVVAVGVFALMFLVVFTVLVILLFPADVRIWAVIGFCALYFIGAVLALLNLKSILKSTPPPFSASLNEMKKDREWFDSSN